MTVCISSAIAYNKTMKYLSKEDAHKILQKRAMEEVMRQVGFSPILVKFLSDVKDLHEKIVAKLPELDEIVQKKFGPKGDKGEPGKAGHTPTDRELAELVRIHLENHLGSLTEERIAEYITPLIPEPRQGEAGLPGKDGKAGLPGKDGMHASPEAVIEKIKQLPRGKKLKVEDLVDDWNDVRGKLLDEVRRTGQAYLHGGGDTVEAGTNVTLARTSGGKVRISASASGSSSIATEKLTPIQSGNNITLDLTGLAHTFTAVLGIYKNGQLLDPGDATFGWSITLNTATVLNAAPTDVFLVNYTY